MTTLTLVRHGQASLGSDDYDRLSDVGHRQAKLLGRHWAGSGARFDRVLVGPLRRHRETLTSIAEGFGERGVELPRAETHEPLCEHQALAVIDRALHSGDRKVEIPTDPRSTKSWFKHFDRVMRNWIDGAVSFDDIESWQQARERVQVVMQEIGSEASDRQLLAVTSGGFVCMAVGHVLGLDDLSVYELSLELRNTAWAEIRITSQGPRLVAFNLHPHLTESELWTLV